MARADETRRAIAALMPEQRSLASLREAAAGCAACPIHENATQTVSGAGPDDARVVLVGEQPGDKEDLAGAPFVGPAGKLLDKVLASVGSERDSIYITNVVKHFKWTPRGKRRLHSKPSASEINGCSAWLEAELELIKPTFVVCLGATAAQALLGKQFRITRERGKIVRETRWAENVLATYHPSALLRMPDRDSFLQARDLLTRDLQLAFDSI